MKPDILQVIEAAYDVEAEPRTWLTHLASQTQANVDFGLGVLGMLYRIGEDGRVKVEMHVAHNIPAEISAQMRSLSEESPQYVRETFASVPCALATESGSPETRAKTQVAMKQLFGRLGWEDIFVVNGVDPTGRGAYLGVPQSHSRRPSHALRTRWSRVAAHLAAANRLRNRIEGAEAKRPESADAILTSSGRVEHANDDVKSTEARMRLRAGVLAIDRARGKLRKSDPDLAVAGWKGLIAAQWTLIDYFESDGKRYLLARRNEAIPSGFAALTARELQALGFAALGHTNKLIAYEMGIAASTVGVLLHRAARKLGARSRAALIATFLAAGDRR